MDLDESMKRTLKSLGVMNDPALEVLKKMSGITSNLDILNKINRTGILSSFDLASQISKSNLDFHSKGLDVPKILQLQRQIKMPDSAIDTLVKIGVNQGNTVNVLKKIASNNVRVESDISRLNNISNALDHISKQFVIRTLINNDHDLLDDTEEITSETNVIADNIVDTGLFTKEDGLKLIELINNLDRKIDAKDKSFKSKIQFYVFVISTLFMIYQIVDILIPKKDLAYYSEIIIKAINKLKEQKEYRVVTIDVKVMLKPRNRGLVLDILHRDFEVVVLQSHHRWVYISYYDELDNLPQTGWVMKKYLRKPKD